MKRHLRLVLPVLATCLVLVLTRAALAKDDFVPFDPNSRPRTDPNPFILGAYGAIWASVLVYVAFLARGISKTRGEVEELRRKLEAASRGR